MQRKVKLFLEYALLLVLAGGFALFFADRESSTAINAAMPGALVRTATDGKLSIFKPEKAFHGLTLYPVTGAPEVLLLDMQGKTVHRWEVDAERARLLPDGNLLVIHGSDWGKDRMPWKNLRTIIREYRWDGSVAWEHKSSDVIHHDARRLPSGNTLFLQREVVPSAKKTSVYDQNLRSTEMRADSIVEVTPDGETVWKWHTYDHLDLNSCGRRDCREVKEGKSNHRIRDWTHVNTASVIPPNKWHTAGDSRFKPGNIMILPRNWWTAFIVDRESGEIVWKYGGDYRGGISGGHEVHMIPPGYPGEGNILLIDNGTVTHRGESFVLELNPVTKEILWKYEAGSDFHTRTRGSVARLPNGNTFISEDETGRVFEVTPEKEIVWEYKGEKEVSRAIRYPYSYCQQCAEAAGQ